MQWIYLICFILISAGLLALFGVKPGDFIDALFRSQRKSATLSDELNVLLGTPAKGFFNQDYELKQILKGTGRADRYEAIKRLSLILFAVGAVLALLIGNVYMVPILGIGFSLIPIWYLRSTAASYKKHLNEELETAISIITTSYLRTEDLIRSVKENLPYDDADLHYDHLSGGALYRGYEFARGILWLIGIRHGTSGRFHTCSSYGRQIHREVSVCTQAIFHSDRHIISIGPN